MKIEVLKTTGRQPWHWHFKNKGRITAAAEAFPSKAHAVRAAKAVVKATLLVAGVGTPKFVTKTLDPTHLELSWYV